MTTDSDIAFWKVLNEETNSYLDSLLFCPAFSRDGLKHPAPVLSCCLLFMFLPICFFAFSRVQNAKEDYIHTRVALQALVAFLVPTCSLWPSRYIKLASLHHSNIDIPFEMIVRDTINGVIEFRNPSDDFVDLIGPGAIANGHTIRITIGWKWWIKCFKWWMLAESKPELHRNTYTDNSNHLDLSPGPFPLTPSTLCPLLYLDRLPHGTIPTLNGGCKATLEFTTFSPSLRILSRAQIISAIPFMVSELPRRQPRPLVSVLKQLGASYGPDMVIESLSNISVEYECALRHMYRSFFAQQKIRETWVKILGIKAGRQEMFLLALEAALVRRGWIERWAIQVSLK